MKRVYCLYRVSTKKQVDRNENDIPMQRTACHEFATRQDGWTIVREFSEKGVSGYKTSAEKRDAINDLKKAALNGEFDVLLVFMFDRIGRIDDETPFVVEWFVKHGIEIWSTQEGQQRFDSHVDKLLNYIRYWQASGESEKTSIRIKNSLQQMEAAGFYTGGPMKYGYRLVDTGLVNKKNQPIRQYAIDPEQAEVVRLIDDMTINQGYGTWRLAQYLNEHGYRANGGTEFTSMKLNRILRDPFYCGQLPNGNSSVDLQAIQIRTVETHRQILRILEQRTIRKDSKRQIAMTTKGHAMLSGNIYCAHCGNRLAITRYQDRKVRADGSIYAVDQAKYTCYHKTRKLCECDGQSTYQVEIIDKIVSEIILKLFSTLKGAPEKEKLQKVVERQLKANRATQKRLTGDLKKYEEQLEKLQLEIGNALVGTSMFQPDDLQQAIRTVKENIASGKKQLEELENEELSKKNTVEQFTAEFNQFKSWTNEFENATLEQKKMIACHLFKRIEIGKGYRVSVQLNMTYQQFCDEWLIDDAAV